MAKPKKPRGISKKDWDDVDNPPLTKKQIQSMRPLKEADPELYEMFAKRRGRPSVKFPKRQLTMRLSSKVVDGLKASGPGYNERVDRILQEALDSGRL
jgi:uncharacterized protein (DUF4415 family)